MISRWRRPIMNWTSWSMLFFLHKLVGYPSQYIWVTSQSRLFYCTKKNSFQNPDRARVMIIKTKNMIVVCWDLVAGARLRAIIINGAAPIIYIVCFDFIYIYWETRWGQRDGWLVLVITVISATIGGFRRCRIDFNFWLWVAVTSTVYNRTRKLKKSVWLCEVEDGSR